MLYSNSQQGEQSVQEFSEQQYPAPALPVYTPTPASVISTFTSMFMEYLPNIMFMVMMAVIVRAMFK